MSDSVLRPSPRGMSDSASSRNDSLDDIFGFEAARKRQEEREKAARVEPPFLPWRVFVNHIDSYHGKRLVDCLPEQEYSKPGTLDEEAAAGGEGVGDEGDREDGGEANGEKVEAPRKAPESTRKYEVIGTVKDHEHIIPEDVERIIEREESEESFLDELMKCGVVIYDITQETSQIAEASWAVEAIARKLEDTAEKTPKAFKRSEEVRYFILISTVMTWTSTKPLDLEEPPSPFTEADYRKRKSHPNFKEHIRCEKDVVMMKQRAVIKDKFKTVVLCCGLTYGIEEGPLHYLFKMAWQNSPVLPVLGRGNNKIPLLHVDDVLSVVMMFLRNWPPLNYIVAVEQELVSQKTIVKKISKALTTGKIQHISKEEALRLDGMTRSIYDTMTTNLIIEPAYLLSQNMHWHSDLPFKNGIDAVVREYRNARNLRPIKVIVLGPPASGKTRVARYISNHYGVHYVHVQSLIPDTIEKLVRAIEAVKTEAAVKRNNEDEAENGEEGGDEEENDDEEETVGVAQLQEQLDEIRGNLAGNNGRLDDEVLTKLFTRKLTSKECQNQGYVIDGHPKTLAQAKALFGTSDEADEEDIDEKTEEGTAAGANGKIMPEFVVSLEASDEFLKERMLTLPEREVQGTHYAEEHILRRLQEFRERNTDDDTPLRFFDEREVHPLVVPIEGDVCPDMFPTFYRCQQKIGKPRTYGPTRREIEEREKRDRAEAERVAAIEGEKRMREAAERKRAREEKMVEWTNLMEKLKQEEEERLLVLGEPLRHYLMKYVFPTLTQGLIEVTKLRPEDPVDYLAEYLFKENPEGKMFEPDYTETMSTLMAAIERSRADILPRGELDEGVDKYLRTSSDDVCTGKTSSEVTEGGIEIEHPDRVASSTLGEAADGEFDSSCSGRTPEDCRSGFR